MKFWNQMAEKKTLLESDILMVGDSADIANPKHLTLATILSWVKTKLGLTTITQGNIPLMAADGTLADSGQRPVKICSDFAHWKAYEIENINKGTCLILEAKDYTTGEYFEADDKDILRFFVPRVNYNGKTDVAITYQYNNIVVRLKDKTTGTIYESNKLVSIAGVEKGYYNQIKDTYGVCFDVQLVRNTDNRLYSRILYGLKGDELVTATIITPDTNITLDATTSTYTISTATATTVGLTAQIDGCSVLLPTTLTADQSVTLVIADSSKAITIGSTTYQPADTIFCVYDYDPDTQTGTWTVNNTKAPVVPDYTDVNVKFVLDNTNFKSHSCVRTTTDEYQVWFSTETKPLTKSMIGQLVAVLENIEYVTTTANETLKNTWRIKPGLYYISGAKGDVANAETDNYKLNIKKLADIDSLSLVTAANENALTQEGIWKVVKSTTGSWFERLSAKADLSEVELKGNKISDVTTATTPGTQYPNVTALTNYVTARITALINNSPTALDTLKELADALGNDANFSTTVTNLIAGKVSLSGDETVTGSKSFTSLLKALAGLYASGNVQLDLGSDATGDMLYRGTDGCLKRIAKGTDGQVLTLASGLPAWNSIAGASTDAIFRRFTIYVSSGSANYVLASLSKMPLLSSNDTDFSNGSIYISDNKILFLEAGNYFVSAQMRGNYATLGSGSLCIYKNGYMCANSGIISSADTTEKEAVASVDFPINISSINDYIEVYANYSSGDFGSDPSSYYNYICVTKLGTTGTTISTTTSISEANPSTAITINSTQQHLALTQTYVHNWNTNYYTVPTAGILEVSGFIEWSASGGTTNPLKINLIVNGVQKTLGTGTQGSTGKIAHIVLCGTVNVSAGDVVYIDGYIGGNTATILTNSEIKYKITN